MISYPAAAPQAQTIYTTAAQPAPVQVTYAAPAVTTTTGLHVIEQQPTMQYASVDQQVAAGSASILPAPSSLMGSASVAPAPQPQTLTYSSSVAAQPQAYYQVGNVQQVAGVQPQHAFSTMAPTATLQPAACEQKPLFEQQQAAMAPTTTAATEPAPALQPETMATTAQATPVASKKAKKKLSSKKKEKACC
mmetsp:Transcript_37314/g.73974  ORF Transcript_37314/g.73974 Transcript_37314/m.73974 type:complete len:192 (+) Transcript_37314:176-751(+)